MLVHHPYESFRTTVEEFVRQASTDPHVLAIKMTLYRTSGDSPIARSLIRRRAGQAGGGHRRAQGAASTRAPTSSGPAPWRPRACTWPTASSGSRSTPRRCSSCGKSPTARGYCHIGTGNYNSRTARTYEDLGLLTCDPDIGSDLTQLFNELTGYGRNVDYRRLLVAPRMLRSGIVDLIRGEVAAAQAEPGRGRITMKMNSLVDTELIDELYAASQAAWRSTSSCGASAA